MTRVTIRENCPAPGHRPETFAVEIVERGAGEQSFTPEEQNEIVYQMLAHYRAEGLGDLGIFPRLRSFRINGGNKNISIHARVQSRCGSPFCVPDNTYNFVPTYECQSSRPNRMRRLR